MENNLLEVFTKITNAVEHIEGKYGFIDGNPVDLSRPKYFIFRFWFDRQQLKCFSCGRKPHHFKMSQCKGHGSIHKPTNQRKHTFKLYSKNGVLFTLDHWYPKWFLKDSGVWNAIDNMVPMCEPCNKKKDNKMPLLGMFGNTFHIPSFTGIQLKRDLHTKVRYA